MGYYSETGLRRTPQTGGHSMNSLQVKQSADTALDRAPREIRNLLRLFRHFASSMIM